MSVGYRSRIARTRFCPLATVGVLILFGLGCKDEAKDGVDQHVTTRGNVEVTAKVVEIPGLEQWEGRFPPNDLGYDYVYILKYQVLDVHRGHIPDHNILVGHYNPLKPRSEAADSRCPDIGGDLKRFRVGDIHRIALDVPIDDHYMGPMFNKYFDRPEGQQPIYWAWWTNHVIR